MSRNFVMYFPTRPRRRKRRFFWVLLLVFLGIFDIYAFRSMPGKPELVSPLSATPYQSKSLKEAIENELIGTKGTYGIVVKNFKTGESYIAKEHNVFQTGSLYKLWILATVYRQIEAGGLSKEQLLSENIATLNRIFNIDANYAELTEGRVSMTVADALNQMITISHNYAALLLTQKVKLSQVSAFLKVNGFTESAVGINGNLPASTPSDIALFYEKLFNGELANEQNTQEMINILKEQKLNDGLPKQLPSGSPIAVAHKTGDLDLFKHDAGIVFSDFGDYIIVVMSESSSPIGAQERIAKVSKAVFDYFKSPK